MSIRKRGGKGRSSRSTSRNSRRRVSKSTKSETWDGTKVTIEGDTMTFVDKNNLKTTFVRDEKLVFDPSNFKYKNLRSHHVAFGGWAGEEFSGLLISGGEDEKGVEFVAIDQKSPYGYKYLITKDHLSALKKGKKVTIFPDT